MDNDEAFRLNLINLLPKSETAFNLFKEFPTVNEIRTTKTIIQFEKVNPTTFVKKNNSN
jgi:hypothetical protein